MIAEYTAWSVDKTGKGRVVIWIVLPMIFETTNMSKPSYTYRSIPEYILSAQSYLPSAPFIWRAPYVLDIFLIFENVGLPLQSQPNALDTGWDKADDYTQLEQFLYQHKIHAKSRIREFLNTDHDTTLRRKVAELSHLGIQRWYIGERPSYVLY